MIKKFKKFNNEQKTLKLKEHLQQLIGKYVQLIKMDDPYGIKPGTIGIIYQIDDINNIFVRWENGETLALIPEIDEYRILSDKEVDKYKKIKKFNL